VGIGEKVFKVRGHWSRLWRDHLPHNGRAYISVVWYQDAVVVFCWRNKVYCASKV